MKKAAASTGIPRDTDRVTKICGAGIINVVLGQIFAYTEHVQTAEMQYRDYLECFANSTIYFKLTKEGRESKGKENEEREGKGEIKGWKDGEW